MRLAALVALACVLACGGPSPADRERPNVVLVVSDDVGYMDHGFMGSPHVATPNLDRLAAKGTVFTHAFSTSSICRPALRSLLTGLAPLQWDTRALERGAETGGLVEELVTLPRALAARGYVSFQAGKFWERDHVVAGFSGGMQQPGDSPAHGGVGRRIGRSVPLDPVLRFLDERGSAPFFLWFAPMLPHVPHDADERFAEPYRGRGLSGPALRYYANVSRFDALVGELLEALEERGLLSSTLVVYLADNGWDQPPDAELVAGAGDGPRGKRTMYEIGWRTPLVFHWPGVVPEKVRSDALVSSLDLFPTLLDYAGAAAPEGRSGRSLRAVIQEGAPWSRERIVGSQVAPRIEDAPAAARSNAPGTLPRAFFVRDREWWYVWYPHRSTEELYSVRDDLRAARDLSRAHGWRVREMRRHARRWAQALPPVEPELPAPAGPEAALRPERFAARAQSRASVWDSTQPRSTTMRPSAKSAR
ncbi:MAG: sulfatase-like hydrolase/transferase [Myxococcota bacterium]|nr:sulfatase-like hydrolase/transferase [Myxococcota bacterium]